MFRCTILFISLLLGHSSYASKCLEHNHSLYELDEYTLIHSKIIAVLSEVQWSESNGIMYIRGTVSVDYKKYGKPNYTLSINKKEVNILQFTNHNLLLLLYDIASDTVAISPCTRLWVWYDDASPAANEQERALHKQRHAVLSQFATMVSGKSFARYTSGKKTASGSYVIGKPHGLWIHYAHDGQLFAKGNYDHGVKVGVWVESYFDAKPSNYSMNDILHKIGYAKGMYRNGVREGKWIFFNERTGSVLRFYKNGELMHTDDMSDN